MCKSYSWLSVILLVSSKGQLALKSAGLVYFHYGRDIIAKLLGTSKNDKLTEKVFEKVYEGFIQEIDAIDNGVSICETEQKYSINTNLSSRVGNLGPKWNDENQDADEGFYKAMELTKSEFLDKVNYYGKVWWAARDIVSKSMEDRFNVHSSGRIVEFEKGTGFSY